MREVKVFVSSPGDLKFSPDGPATCQGEPANKRELVKDILQKLNGTVAYRNKYKFIPYLYEDLTPAVINGQGPQEIVDEWMLHTRQADIVVCMLWSRMGTPQARKNPDTGRPYQSGTEYEFYDAYRARRNLLARHKPEILLYRYTAKVRSDADPVQIAEVIEFFNRFDGPHASLRGMYKRFESPAELEKTLTTDLELWIKRQENTVEQVRALILNPISWGFLGLLALLLFVVYLIIRPGELQSYGFNVAVAGFIPSPNEVLSDRDVQTLTNTFFTNLDSQLAALRNDTKVVLKPGAWPPSRVGVVKGDTPQDREKNAEALVDQLKKQNNLQTDLVVYGAIERYEGQLVVVPEFYVSTKSAELSELYGRFKLEDVLTAGSPDQLKYLSAQLTTRSETLSHVVEGIIYMILQDYDTAYQAFEPCLKVNASDPVGKELIYILMGNAAISSHNKLAALGDPRFAPQLSDLLTKAEQNFSEAVKLDPDYSRGYAGLGSIQYLRVLESVSAREAWQEINDPTLNKIEETFQKALKASDRPDSADIPTKVAFGIGQVYVLRSLRGDQDASDRAEKQFMQVIADYYNGKNQRVQEFAAQAYGFLGLLRRQRSDFSGARSAYNAAIDLTQLNTRRDLFKQSVLDISFEENRATGKIDVAVKAYDDLFSQFPQMPAHDKAVRLFYEGKMLSEAGHTLDATKVYEQALMLDLASAPELAAQLWAELGDKYYDLSRLADSISAYEKALELDPTHQRHLKKVIDEIRLEMTPTTAPAAVTGAAVAPVPLHSTGVATSNTTATPVPAMPVGES